MKLFSIMPKTDKFNDHLLRLSSTAHECARHLRAYVAAGAGEDTAALARQIGESKARAKETMGFITRDLCRSYITPFDREDIQSFAQCLYKIPKGIEKIQHRLMLHDFRGDVGDFLRQIDLVLEEAELMDTMTANTVARRDIKRVPDKVAALHALEQKGDDVLQELLTGLFRSERGVKDLMIRRDIYDLLERVIDNYRNAGNVILQIVLKYG